MRVSPPSPAKKKVRIHPIFPGPTKKFHATVPKLSKAFIKVKDSLFHVTQRAYDPPITEETFHLRKKILKRNFTLLYSIFETMELGYMIQILSFTAGKEKDSKQNKKKISKKLDKLCHIRRQVDEIMGNLHDLRDGRNNYRQVVHLKCCLFQAWELEGTPPGVRPPFQG